MKNIKIKKIILSALVINMVLSLVIPQSVFSQSEYRQPASPTLLPELPEPDQNSLNLSAEDLSSVIYLPFVFNTPPSLRENITLSIFSLNGEATETYEKNVDSNGIPLLVEGYTNGDGYHPSYICRYALYVAAAYDSNPTDEYFRKIQNVVTWIINNRVEGDNYITWELKEDLPIFNLKAPWTSALTNAWCSAALLQGYKITGDEELEPLARAGLEYLFTPVSDGGGLYEFDNGDIWFEECPSIETPSHILNGFIFAIDVLDMFNSYYTSSYRYQYFLDKAIASLGNRIDQYDVKYGSIYDLYTRGNKLGADYHYLHYVQLYYMYLRSGNPRFLEYSEKWYALTYQYQYELLDSSGVNDSLRVINDGIYWYNYVLVKLPKEFSFNFERPYELQAINFFLFGDNNPTDSMTISYSTANETYIEIPPTEYTIELTGSNNTNGHITNVYTVSLNAPIETQSIRINFEKTASNDVGVFREIGILKNMNDEYQEQMANIGFEDVVSMRMRNRP